MVKGDTAKKNLAKLVKERDEMREEIISLINDAKDLDPKEKKEQFEKASALYTKLRKHESNKIKKNQHFNTPEGKKGLKRYTPAGDTKVLVDKKGKLKEDLFKILNEGTIFTGKAPGKSIRGKKDSGDGAGAGSADVSNTTSVGSAETADTNVAEDPDFDELSPPKEPTPPKKAEPKETFGQKEDKTSKLQEEEVSPAGAPVGPPDDVMTEGQISDARIHMRDWLNNLKDEEVDSWAEVYEAGVSSDSPADHLEKQQRAFALLKMHLGPGYEALPKEQLDLMFKWYYATGHVDDPETVEAAQPTEPDINNDGPGATPQNADEAFTQDDINNLTIEDEGPPIVPPPDVSNNPAAQSTTFSDRTTQQDAPEFQPFNPPENNVNIEIDDTGAGPPVGSGIPVSGGLPGANMMTSSSLLNSMSFPTDAAQKLVEDRMRQKKGIEALKEEIRAMHLIYDDDIPSFKKQPHVGQKNDALKSNDIKVVRAHHKSMQDTIRNYYKTSDLKVGVILSAEGFFGGGAGMNPNLAALSQARVPELGGSVRVSKPGHEFDNAVAGQTRVNRLGRNYKKPVSRNVPKVGTGPTATNLKEMPQTDDVERPFRSQRGFRQRRINSNIPGLKVVLKTGKK